MSEDDHREYVEGCIRCDELSQPCWLNEDCIAGWHMDEIDCRFPGPPFHQPTPQVTLPEFLLARMAEDEAVARKFEWQLVRDFGMPAATGMTSELTPAGAEQMDYPVLTIDSTRVLAECEAKREIVAEYFDALAESRCRPSTAWRYSPAVRIGTALRTALAYLALPYAEHPDWREEWRP